MHHARSASRILVLSALLLLTASPTPGIVSPRLGGPLPEPVLEARRMEKGAFSFRRGWIRRRDRQVSGMFPGRAALPADIASHPLAARALSGELRIPVLPGLYDGVAEPPTQPSTLQTLFFDGPWPSGTLSEYFDEVSFGLLDVGGTVFDWTPLANGEAYYTGGWGGTSLGSSKTGEMIKEILDTRDPGIDFGLYDNDGPDGVPNSGDDDGFVDVIVFVHPEMGAECNNNMVHMWSHSWVYSVWPVSGNQPYATNDPAAGGGTILIDDYIIGPALSCESTAEEDRLIEIGVFCHEIGHGLGLYDLYDDYGGYGIGYWGLMGAGNWNTPASPAHPCAWSREQLGWIDPVEIDWRAASLTLQPIESGGQVARLDLPTRRFRRRTYQPIAGGTGLVVGYTSSEAVARGYIGGGGYGNEWNESMIRGFHTDGSTPVTLVYDVLFDLETSYDFGLVLLECGGEIDTLAAYTGPAGGGRETIPLDPYLPGGPCDFTIRFLFRSDVSYSDEDGGFYSEEGCCFTIDNVSVEGGGIDHAADFEEDAGGWRADSPAAEYFIVENRRRIGFDANLPGEGLIIWHAENSIAYSILGNSGGYSNSQARGVVLEEADGEYNLIKPLSQGGNSGDEGDPFPGGTGNTSFSGSSDPSSHSNSLIPTPVSITGIRRSGSAVTALFAGGMYAPEITGVAPDSVDLLSTGGFKLDISGEGILHGADCLLVFAFDTVWAESVEWLGEEKIVADFSAGRLYSGLWDVVVVSGDGQTASAEQALSVSSVYESFAVSTGRDYIDLEWTLMDLPGVRGCLVYRSEEGGPFLQLTSDTLRSDTGAFHHLDRTLVPERRYAYRVETFVSGLQAQSLVIPGPYTVPDLPFIADQNFPNPFSDGTIIGFFNPSPRIVSIDIYDVAGRRIESFGSREYPRGTQRFAWAPPANLASGVYFCVFRTERTTKAVKMILVR